MKLSTYLAAGALLLAGAANASTTIDFTKMALGTSVSTVGIATFKLYGAPVASGSPVIGAFGANALSNSKNGTYPTSSGIEIDFTNAVKALSFTYNNYGGSSSFEQAFDGKTSVDKQVIGSIQSYATVTVKGEHITSLKIDNGFNGSRSWQFGVGQLTFSNAVPEPATWAMMLAGFGLVGATMRRRSVKYVVA